MTADAAPSLIIALLGIFGAIVAAWFGAERAGRYSLKVARENRQASFQRETLIEIQDKLPAFMTAVDNVRWAAQRIPSLATPPDRLPPPPTRPTMVILREFNDADPEDADTYPAIYRELRISQLWDALAAKRLLDTDLERLASRVTEPAINSALTELLAIADVEWYQHAVQGNDQARKDQDHRRTTLNAMIGRQVGTS